MIFGIGVDIAKCSRFEKWVKNPKMISRFFNEKEFFERGENPLTKNQICAMCQHYAARFAAKEAFSKALGTGLAFDLRNVFVQNEKSGKPQIFLEGDAKKIFFEKCGGFDLAKIFLSLSHEKEFSVATVVIESA